MIRHTPHPDDDRVRAATGLSESAARARRLADGPNELPRRPPPGLLRRSAQQFANPVVWLPLVACVVSLWLGDVFDALAVAIVLVANAAVGLLQDARAERAITALASVTAPRARVVREGRTRIVPAREVVVGDLLSLEAGDRVAADARVVGAHALMLDEAVLTGESLPVARQTAAENQPPTLVMMGTSVVAGTGLAEVTAIGGATELGKIAALLTTSKRPETPLQQRLARTTRALAGLCGATVACVAAAGWWHGWSAREISGVALSLAVAAVPEGLPAVVTIALAMGVQRLAARNVLVRRLSAVETLGCTSVICTDKTGTLTQGVMAVREIWAGDERALLFAAAACCDAELDASGGGVGDPTEVAILRAARDRGIERAGIERERPRVDVTPFDSTTRMMSVTRADGHTYIKGAFEVLAPMTGADAAAQAAHARMAGTGLRVLAVAVAGRDTGDGAIAPALVGLIGIGDPLRPEALDAVRTAAAAGVTTVMITGDHPVTAFSIARELGILRDGADPEGIVHARATPTEKLAIVRRWRDRGAVVAMTGDGVNDAPALHEAHVGVAMGITGTEVAREAADVVLADDNFASIVAGIVEGRAVFENIRKTTIYLLTGNVAELGVMMIAALGGLPVPLLPVQLLWINIVTDGFPALALVGDPTSDELLQQAPRPLREPMLGSGEWRMIAGVAAIEVCVTLLAFIAARAAYDVPTAQAMAFSTLVYSELLRAFAARSPTRTYWRVGPGTNLRLAAVVVGSIAVQVAIASSATLNHWLGARALPLPLIAAAFLLGLIPVSLIEIRKQF